MNEFSSIGSVVQFAERNGGLDPKAQSTFTQYSKQLGILRKDILFELKPGETTPGVTTELDQTAFHVQARAIENNFLGELSHSFNK
jgi:hypothetical protein